MSRSFLRAPLRRATGALAFVLATAGADHSRAEGEPERILSGHSKGVTAVDFTANGKWLVSASHDGSLIVWAADTRERARTLEHGAELYGLALSPDDTTAVSAGDDHRLGVWSLEDGLRKRVVELPSRPLACVFVRGDEVAVGHSNGQVLLVSVVSGAVNRTIDHGTEVLSLAVAHGQGVLAVGPYVKLWNTAKEAEPSSMGGVLGFGCLDFSPDGKLLASGDWTGGASIAAVASGTRVSRLAHEVEREAMGPTGPVTSKVNMPVCAVAFSPDGALLASGGGCTTVKVWSVPSDGAGATLIRTLSGHAMTVTSVAFAPDSRLLASGALDNSIRVWDLAD